MPVRVSELDLLPVLFHSVILSVRMRSRLENIVAKKMSGVRVEMRVVHCE